MMTKFDVRVGLIVGSFLCWTACSGRSAMLPNAASGAGGLDGLAGAGAGGASGLAGTGGATAGACPTDLPDVQQLAATPRANTNLELLALKFSPGVIAEQAIYDRLTRDVGLITARDPSISDIEYFAPHDGKQLLIEADAGTLDQMQAGTYHDWDCLNDTYGVLNLSFDSGLIPVATLTLEGIYNLELLSKDYAALPGLRSVSPNIVGGDGPTICVVREDGVWHYVFDRAGGDCPAGCTEHEYSHFTVTTAGAVTALGQPSSAEISRYASNEACR